MSEYLKNLCTKRLYYMKLEGEMAKKKRLVEKEIVLYHVTRKEKEDAKLRMDKNTWRNFRTTKPIEDDGKECARVTRATSKSI